jgi:hypothetical protein
MKNGDKIFFAVFFLLLISSLFFIYSKTILTKNFPVVDEVLVDEEVSSEGVHELL